MTGSDERWREQLQHNQRVASAIRQEQARWQAQTEVNDHVVAQARFLQTVRQGIRELGGRLGNVESRVDEHAQRLDAHGDLIDQHGAAITDLQDSRVATNRRVSALERQTNAPNSPVNSLLLGVIVALAWTAIFFVLKALFGDNLKVTYDAKEIVLRDHPQFGDLTTAILVAGLIFILVATVTNMIIDLVSSRSQRPQNVDRPQAQEPPIQGEPTEPEPIQAEPQPTRQMDQPVAAEPVNGRY